MARITRPEAAQTLRQSPVLEQAQPASAVAATALWVNGAAVWWQKAHGEWSAEHMSRNRA